MKKEASYKGYLLKIMIRSISYIRQQRNVTCSLDSRCKLSLVICTGAGNTSGQYLYPFGHALSELSDIFIVYLFCSVNTEHTNLLTASLHRSS